MNVTKSVETRTVENIRYVEVKSLAALGSDLLTAGVGRVKVIKLASGGYSVNPLGDTALWQQGGYGWDGIKCRHTGGLSILRVDGEEVYVRNLFD